jgi:putative hemolysin
MLEIRERLVAGRKPHLQVRMATGESEIREAQRLRYRVFAEEMGARLTTRSPGVDEDLFDRHCDHLVVRDQDTDAVVGTYRILPPPAARRAGAYYSEGEFDLTRLHNLRNTLVEVGRSCIDAEYRSGAVIALLWAGLARYMTEHGFDYLIGCASIGMADGGHNAANVFASLQDHLSPLEYRAFARHPLPWEHLQSSAPVEVPALIKGYLRAGAWVCGEPAWDPDFNTADLLVMLPMARIDARYARHFVERSH